jgi:NAD(P)-dependent dehydrogenase (short-subunit alcohol dehydrogenase family)
MRLRGKVCLITGAGSGLGREAARLFVAEAASTFVADINLERAEETSKLIAEEGGDAEALRCDVTSEADIAAAVDAVLEMHGRVDVVTANAGIVSDTLATSFEEISEVLWRRTIDTNLNGRFLTAKHAVGVWGMDTVTIAWQP